MFQFQFTWTLAPTELKGIITILQFNIDRNVGQTNVLGTLRLLSWLQELFQEAMHVNHQVTWPYSKNVWPNYLGMFLGGLQLKLGIQLLGTVARIYSGCILNMNLN